MIARDLKDGIELCIDECCTRVVLHRVVVCCSSGVVGDVLPKREFIGSAPSAHCFSKTVSTWLPCAFALGRLNAAESATPMDAQSLTTFIACLLRYSPIGGKALPGPPVSGPGSPEFRVSASAPSMASWTPRSNAATADRQSLRSDPRRFRCLSCTHAPEKNSLARGVYPLLTLTKNREFKSNNRTNST
jgi:hypothetical protein